MKILAFHFMLHWNGKEKGSANADQSKLNKEA